MELIEAWGGIEPLTVRFSVGRRWSNREHGYTEFRWREHYKGPGFKVGRGGIDRVDYVLSNVFRQGRLCTNLDDAWKIIAAQSQKGFEVEVLSDDDPISLTREVKNVNVGSVRAPNSAPVFDLMPYACEEITPQGR